ncbi:MAG: GYD domain-containing protein [Elusimicrobia bacterium]|nr:GYD domain-containing protein [Elusimicrobiota bacterium]
MAKYFLFGKYSQDALKSASADRTKKVVEIIEKLNGKVISMDVLLGDKDLAIAVDLPNTSSVVKASIAITKLTGIGFSSSPAISVDEFDKLLG